MNFGVDIGNKDILAGKWGKSAGKKAGAKKAYRRGIQSWQLNSIKGASAVEKQRKQRVLSECCYPTADAPFMELSCHDCMSRRYAFLLSCWVKERQPSFPRFSLIFPPIVQHLQKLCLIKNCSPISSFSLFSINVTLV